MPRMSLSLSETAKITLIKLLSLRLVNAHAHAHTHHGTLPSVILCVLFFDLK